LTEGGSGFRLPLVFKRIIHGHHSRKQRETRIISSTTSASRASGDLGPDLSYSIGDRARSVALSTPSSNADASSFLLFFLQTLDAVTGSEQLSALATGTSCAMTCWVREEKMSAVSASFFMISSIDD